MHRQEKGPVPASKAEWWRFSQYRIERGWIRPAPSARLEWYDPWREFFECRKLTTAQPPYQSLMRRVRELKYRPNRGRFVPESLERIAQWCQQHGPLGILLSCWESIAVSPIWRESDDFDQLRYVRGPGQSVQQIRSSGNFGDQEVKVLIHDLDDLTLKQEGPAQTWYRFFPSVASVNRNTFQYPIPYSDEFCALYSERITDFCSAASLLAGAVTHLRDKDVDLRSLALYTINLLRRPVSSVVDFDHNGHPESRWEAPSLIAAFAEMYVQDLLYGRPALICACCGNPYVWSAYQSEYCSDACRMRGQKRSVRQKIKDAKARYAAGNTIEQIAAALGEKQELVQGWITAK